MLPVLASVVSVCEMETVALGVGVEAAVGERTR